MAVKLNKTGYNHARDLIEQGKVDRDSSWSFTADDGNKILGDDKDWNEYKKWFLGIDADAAEDTKEHYKFPYGKNGKVYRSGVIAAKQRAAQHNYSDIEDAADRLLNMIDKDKSKKEAISIEEKDKEVVFLVDPEASYISLVTRGANRVPFKVIKSENKEKPMRVVQSIIAPADLSREDLLKMFGDELKDVLKFDKAVGTKTKNYEQLPRDLFKEDSFELVKLTDDVMAVCGSLKEDSGFISKLFRKTKETKGVEIPDEIEKVDDKEKILKVSALAYDELFGMFSAVEGILSTPGIELGDRIESLKKIFDGFTEYIENIYASTSVSKFDFDEVKRLRETSEKNQEPAEKNESVETQNKDEENDSVTKTEDNLDQTVEEVVKSSLETITKEFGELINSVKQELKELTEKVEKLESTIPVAITVESDSDLPTNKKSESIFKGAIFGR